MPNNRVVQVPASRRHEQRAGRHVTLLFKVGGLAVVPESELLRVRSLSYPLQHRRLLPADLASDLGTEVQLKLD